MPYLFPFAPPGVVGLLLADGWHTLSSWDPEPSDGTFRAVEHMNGNDYTLVGQLEAVLALRYQSD